MELFIITIIMYTLVSGKQFPIVLTVLISHLKHSREIPELSSQHLAMVFLYDSLITKMCAPYYRLRIASPMGMFIK